MSHDPHHTPASTPPPRAALRYPALLGILGGGQLARMTAEAASQLGIEVAIMEKEANSPAGRIAAREIVGGWLDFDRLAELADGVLAVTLENEFVDVAALEWLEARGVAVYPGARTLALTQDKYEQKRFMRAAGVPTTDFAPVTSAEDVTSAAEQWGWPLVLKGRRNSYDGYGNATLEGPDDLAPAFERLGFPERTLYIERWAPFTRELAVIVARGRDGEMVDYPTVETVQRNHICHVVRAPAPGAAEVARRAREIARAVVEAIDGVGVFGVELFELSDGTVLYNEIAPRPHNTGHYTIEGCVTSQFENHVRAALGLPLGSAEMVAPAAVMVNTLGVRNGPAEALGMARALAISGAHVHVYGKLATRVGRKMGHITALGPSVAEAEATARAAADALDL
ncbi:MAG TPA: 5-(carboxyamino)imidazole ribonucleotide synthase [Ktedonobacterales bacterium]|nr:5-(carboxyamino)imidazole ribonucleotide synthase [Ktedonobacterales bacterium]